MTAEDLVRTLEAEYKAMEQDQKRIAAAIQALKAEPASARKPGRPRKLEVAA
jgi:outer membrane murein-binding lipoprotein Lpp